jgi:competence protein ComEA
MNYIKSLSLILGVLVFGVAIGHLLPVNINTANPEQLSSLKGIGIKKARAIIANRKQAGEFHSVNDLTRIKGLGKVFMHRLIKNNPGRILLKKP